MLIRKNVNNDVSKDSPMSPVALPVYQFLLITDSVNDLYLDILQSVMSPPPQEVLIDEIILIPLHVN